MEQRCFNDFSISIYKLWYKKLLSEVRDQKTKRTATVTKGTRGNVSHKVRRQSISQERGRRLNSFVLKRMFTKGDPSLPHTMTSVPGSSVLFRLKRDKGLMRDSTEESSLQKSPDSAGEDSWVPWTARRSNQSILKEIKPECSLEGLMLRLKLRYFGHLTWRANSLEKTLMKGKIEGKRRGQTGWDG